MHCQHFKVSKLAFIKDGYRVRKGSENHETPLPTHTTKDMRARAPVEEAVSRSGDGGMRRPCVGSSHAHHTRVYTLHLILKD
jgi:hypothetical protein